MISNLLRTRDPQVKALRLEMADAEARLELERRKVRDRLCRSLALVSIGIFGMLPRITCNTIAAFVSGSQAKKHSETLEHEVNMLSTYMYTLGR